MTERAVFQEESNFLSQIQINGPDKNLSHQTNRQCFKVMVSAGLTWCWVRKLLFANDKGLKVNVEIKKKESIISGTK